MLAQITFWTVGGVLSVALTAAFYPGVRRQAGSARDSALAASMAALLCATTCALASSFVVNAVARLVGG